MNPVQPWVPDTRHPDFAQECQRQSLRAAQADSGDAVLPSFMHAALGRCQGGHSGEKCEARR